MQSLNVNDLKQICRDFKIKGFSKLTKAELIEFVLDSLAEEEISEVLNQKEFEIISNGIELALNKIKGLDRESISDIKIVNSKNHEIEILFKGMNWEITSYLSITSENFEDPERDCDCRIGSNAGFCGHFWVGFIFSLKQNWIKLKDWNLTRLPKDFEKKIQSVKLTTSPVSGDKIKDESLSLVDESSDSYQLKSLLNSRVTIYEGEIIEIVERESDFQGNITIYYSVAHDKLVDLIVTLTLKKIKNNKI